MLNNVQQTPEIFKTLSFANWPSLWSVEPTGDWAEDNKTGRAYAEELIAYMQERNAPNVLAAVVRDMVKQGRDVAGIETGFFQVISHRCITN